MSAAGWVMIAAMVLSIVALICMADFIERHHPPDQDDGTRTESFDDDE